MGVAQREKRVRKFLKHMGPSAHPSGSPQDVHGRGTGAGTDPATKPGTGDTKGPKQLKPKDGEEKKTTSPTPDATRPGDGAEGTQPGFGGGEKEAPEVALLDKPIGDQDVTSRPTTFEEFIGQRGPKGNSGPVPILEQNLLAAKNMGKVMPHVLLSGPPGLGKTTLAGIIAASSGQNVIQVIGSDVNSVSKMTTLLSQIQEGDILFIDEIHALDRNVQEILLPAMEDFKMNIAIGGQNIRIDLPQFTLIGATTQKGGLDAPFKERFLIDADLEPLKAHEIGQVIDIDAAKKGINLEPGVSAFMAGRAQGVPRRANHFVEWAKVHVFSNDFGEFSPGQAGSVSLEDAEAIFELNGIDAEGLDKNQRGYLRALDKVGSAVGVKTLSSMTGKPKQTIETTIEPYLMREGFYTQTRGGRLITTRGKAHLESLEADDIFSKSADKDEGGVRPKVLKHLGPGDHPSGSPQSVHGSGTRGVSRGDIESDIETSGGFTVDPATGARPTEGYMVALEQFEQIYPPGTLTAAKIGKYRATNWEQFADIEGAHWGGWKEADGTVTFDVSLHSDSLETAMEMGRQWNQKAIYNLNDGTEIFLDDKVEVAA